MTNEEIADLLDSIAELMEISGENEFKIRAYRKAAQTLRMTPESVSSLVFDGKLEKLPGIGKSIALQIKQAVMTGKMPQYESLIEKFPPQLVELLKVPGIGPKTARILYESLGISSIEELEKAVNEGSIRKVRGIGAKTVSKLKRIFLERKADFERMLLPEAEAALQIFESELRKSGIREKTLPAGSLRRKKETIGDIDVVIVTNNAHDLIQKVSRNPFFTDTEFFGGNVLKLKGRNKINYDLLLTEAKNEGFSLFSFTGSKDHFFQISELAKSMGLTIDFSGVKKRGRIVEIIEEKDIYALLGMQYIPPEIREGWGEVNAALEGRVPEILQLNDLKGDTHVHSNWSDSSASLQELAESAISLGYEYIVIADHARRLKVASGLTPDEIYERNEEIDRLNRLYAGKIRILKGVELNIDKDGSVDYSLELLSTFDCCIASLHWNLDGDKKTMTKRLLSAMENPYVDIIGHPTTRLFPKRLPSEIDFDTVFKMAEETKTIFEINAFPDRLDLPPKLIKKALEHGIKFSIGTDAHSLSHLPLIRYGVYMARKGWAGKDDILNTLGVNDFIKEILERRKVRQK